MDSFPFLRLPLLPAHDIMRMMDVADLLRIASCNKKVREVAEGMKQIKVFSGLAFEQKQKLNSADVFQLLQIHLNSDFPKFFRDNPFSFNVIISNDIGIEIQLKSDRILRWHIFTESIGHKKNYSGKEHKLSIENQLVPAILTSKSELYTFWSNRMDGFKFLVSWLMRSCNIQFEAFHVEQGAQSNYSEELKSITNFVNYRQYSYDILRIDERKRLMSTEDVNFVTRNVNVFNKYYHLGGRTDSKTFSPGTVIQAKHMLISSARWFLMSHLSMTNCVSVFLVDSIMQNHELNQFVKEWLDGKFPRLKHIKIKTLSLWISDILSKTGVVRRGYIRNGVYKSTNDELVQITVGAVVGNLEGSLSATVLFPSDHLKRLKTFEMVIWPDFDGLNYDRNEVIPHGI